MEIWKEIPGFENRYAVSNQGRVKRIAYQLVNKNGKVIKMKDRILMQQRMPGNDALYVFLKQKDNNKLTMRFVRCLVAEAFLENPKNNAYVLNIDGNPKNNTVDNLKYTNRKNGKNSKAVICDGMYFNSISECAKYYDVQMTTISGFVNGSKPISKRFRDMGLRYAEDK